MRLLDLPGRDEAREAAQRELSRRAYDEAKPPLAYRVLAKILDYLGKLLDRTASSVPGGRLGVLLLGLLLIGVVAVVVVRLRPQVRGTRSDQLFDGGRVLTAQDHRALAERAAATGDVAEAVRERLRAVVRELEQRGVLDVRPGRTADEVAREAGRVVPSIGEPLRRAASVFDEIWYGGRAAQVSAYDVVVEVDRLVTQTRLVRA